MSEPEPVGTIVLRILWEMMQNLMAEVAGEKKDWEEALEQLEQDKQNIRNMGLWPEPPPPAPRPTTRLRLIQGGKED